MNKKAQIIIPLLLVFFAFASCMDYNPFEKKEFKVSGNGLFITNEGNFQYGNASLSYYNTENKEVDNDVFFRANGRKLGDVAQSMTVHDGKGYVVINNSGAVYVIDLQTFEILGGITKLTSPRYVHFVSDTKAYITDLYAPTITIFNPQTLQKTGYIDTKGHKSTEQMVQYGKYVFTNCWSYDNKILVIDTEKDEMVDEITVGVQPTSLTLDKYGKIWTITDGGYEGSPYGYEAPTLYKIDASTRTIEKTFTFKKGERASEVVLNGARDTLYFINEDIWCMDVTDTRIPVRPFLKSPNKSSIYYGLTIDPYTSEVYVADAIDYVQHGVIYRFTPEAVPVDTFKVGIIPGAFCFKYNRP
ncbi:YncE family protein [Bacteroides sp.]|uniref:YncE family protein n=1 Tax=Bacteroides sp. TaxID=29523 RepID=UPI0026094775|nr:DUF5074 domain-containing protein [Bacteroides sp.]MDD3038665.1 YncE family protein [Bacteroides sp.]